MTNAQFNVHHAAFIMRDATHIAINERDVPLQIAVGMAYVAYVKAASAQGTPFSDEDAADVRSNLLTIGFEV